MKTRSDGEILPQKRNILAQNGFEPAVTSASEEILRSLLTETSVSQSDPVTNEYIYFQHKPIQDEGVCLKQSLLTPPATRAAIRAQDSLDSQEDFHEHLICYK